MRLPFTAEQFFDVFRQYNDAVWPAQWLLTALAVVAIVVALRDRPRSGQIVSAILAVLWVWTALVYHLAFFARVNGAAVAFAVACVVEGLAFARLARRGTGVSYRPSSDVTRPLGAAMIAYGLVVYPVLGYLLGHRYPAAPTFGVPCPTTIFTLGLLVWSRDRTPRWLAAIPLAWALIGVSAAINFGMVEDFGLLVSGVAAAIVLFTAGHDATLGSTRQGAVT